MLIENALLEYVEVEQLYKTTDKGSRLLKIYDKVGEYFAPDASEK